MNVSSFLAFTANHLWQSTLFAAVVAVMIALLKQNAARIRFCLWLAASLKFLVPFSILVSIGDKFARSFDTPSVIPVNVSVIFGSLSRPFVASTPTEASMWPSVIAGIWLAGSLFFAARACRHWLNIAASVNRGFPAKDGPTVAALRKAEGRLERRDHVAVVVSTTGMEPGLFGILRPVLVLPAGLESRLTSAQLETVLIHELCHLRRRDNLWAALHTAVQTVFWFHPLVWWLTPRLVDERERACDEAVLDCRSEAQAYAEAMIAICKYYVSSPLKFVAGVTGSTLERRIEGIMTYKFVNKLDIRRKLLLAAAITLTLAGPVLIGVFNVHAIALLPTTATPQTGSPRVFEKWLNEDVVYIISDEERTTFENLRFDEEREHFIENFWLRRDPTPGTPENEFKVEHYERIAYAERRFSWTQPGWTTDRGRILILLGKPDEIESHPRASTTGGSPTYPYEMWSYKYIEGLGRNATFTFIDPAETGEYRLLGKFR